MIQSHANAGDATCYAASSSTRISKRCQKRYEGVVHTKQTNIIFPGKYKQVNGSDRVYITYGRTAVKRDERAELAYDAAQERYAVLHILSEATRVQLAQASEDSASIRFAAVQE